ncbi:unnamed protein product, partial [Scytosiphon promiscuus]
MHPDELHLREAIEQAAARSNEDGGREALHLQGRLARFLRDSGTVRYPEAEIAYASWMEGLQNAARAAGSNQTSEEKTLADRELAECVSEYMDVLEEQGKDLEDLMWELLSVDKRVYGQESTEVANDMDRCGRYLASKQDYRQAEPLLKKALAMKERSRGKDHPEIAGILRAIGRVLFDVNGLTDAGEAFDRALSIDQKNGSNPADIIEDMRSLGMVYCRQGNYERAETMYRRVVDMDKRYRDGEEDPAVITEMNVLAVLLYAQGKMDQAHGRVNSETVACLSWIAETHQKQGHYKEAEAILVEVVDLNRQILGDDKPGVADSLSDLAELRRAQGNLAGAEANHLEALQIRVTCYGEYHETVAQSAQLLSLLLQSEGRENEASDYGRRVVAIRENLHASGGRPTSVRNPPGGGNAGSHQEHVS